MSDRSKVPSTERRPDYPSGGCHVQFGAFSSLPLRLEHALYFLVLLLNKSNALLDSMALEPLLPFFLRLCGLDCILEQCWVNWGASLP